MEIEQSKRDIITACKSYGITKPEEIQYVLATVEWETNGTYQPVREAYWMRNYDKYLRRKKYYPYYGRGFVQITWKENYKKFGDILNLDLVENPDLALEFSVALFILIHGMREGLFTRKKLSHYFNDNGSDFIGARRIINGTDKAEKIAKIAQGIKVSI